MVRWTGKKFFWRAFFPVTGLICSAAAAFCLRFTTTPTQALILLCIAAYMVDMNQACHWANIVDIGGRYAAMAFGFMNMIGNIGNSVAPITNERLFNVYGWNALFTVNAILLCSATIFWFFNDPHKRFYPYEADAPVGPRGFDPVLSPTPSTDLKCPKCNEALSAGAQFCGACGYQLIPPRP
jgi:dipeptide/tripeptide permease